MLKSWDWNRGQGEVVAETQEDVGQGSRPHWREPMAASRLKGWGPGWGLGWDGSSPLEGRGCRLTHT